MSTHQDKAVMLLRVSTLPQAMQGTSLETQEAACRQVLAQKNIEIYKVYREDGKSGALYLTRDDVQAAIRDIEEGKANVFISHKLDRAARDVDVLRDIRRRVLNAGGRFIFDGMEFESNAAGDMMFTNLASFAEFERKSISERTKGGRLRKAMEHKQQPCRTICPYGYHVVNKQDILRGVYPANLLGKYIIIREREDTVRAIFRQYATGTSMKKIVQWLKDEGIKSPEGLEEWPAISVRRLLSHPAYIGQPVFRRTRRIVDESRVTKRGRFGKILTRSDYSVTRPEHEWIQLECTPLVDVATWEECQRRLAENQSRHGGNPKRKYLLGGLVICPVCKRVTAGSKQKKACYYTCPHLRGCKWRVNSRQVEEWVIRGIMTVAARPELAKAAEQAIKARLALAFDADLYERLQHELSGLDKRESAVVEAQVDALMNGRNAEVYVSKLSEINARRLELREKIAVMEVQRGQAALKYEVGEMVAQAISSVQIALDSPHLLPCEKNEILSSVVDAVRPDMDCQRFVIVLRPFFCDCEHDTHSRFLIRVTVSLTRNSVAVDIIDRTDLMAA